MPKQRNHDRADVNATGAVAARQGQHTGTALAARVGRASPSRAAVDEAGPGREPRCLLGSARAGVARRRDVTHSTGPAARSTHRRGGLAHHNRWTLGLRARDRSWSRRSR
jgi:hypothetical protein